MEAVESSMAAVTINFGSSEVAEPEQSRAIEFGGGRQKIYARSKEALSRIGTRPSPHTANAHVFPS